MSGLRFRNAACWGLVFFKCEDLTISGIDVHNRAYWNNDGIDVVDCHRVEIANSHIDAADDGILRMPATASMFTIAGWSRVPQP